MNSTLAELVEQLRTQPEDSLLACLNEIAFIADEWSESACDDETIADAKTMKLFSEILTKIIDDKSEL